MIFSPVYSPVNESNKSSITGISNSIELISPQVSILFIGILRLLSVYTPPWTGIRQTPESTSIPLNVEA